MAMLGGVDLGKDFYIENYYGRSAIDGVMVRARDNTPHIWEQSSGPLPIDLVGEENRAVLRGSQMSALHLMANTVGSTYTLVYNSISRTVQFRTWEQPVIEHAPLVPREIMDDNAVYRNVRIKLMEV